MIKFRYVNKSLLNLCLSMTVIFLLATIGAAYAEYEPLPYQPGKDVVWVPTAQALADKMLDLAKVTSKDYVIDLGSGDGRIVITAAKRGARSVGIEYNPDMVALSKRNAEKEGVRDAAQFMKADLFESDFSQATVITMFLLPEINLKLRPKILTLRPGTRVVSNSFSMDDWEADQTVAITAEEGCDNSFCEAYFWVVPARVEGAWKLPQGELWLNQSFQKISGTLKSGTDVVAITNGRMNGNLISFTAGNKKYTGTVSGNTIQGTLKSVERTVEWNASRESDKVKVPPN